MAISVFMEKSFLDKAKFSLVKCDLLKDASILAHNVLYSGTSRMDGTFYS